MRKINLKLESIESLETKALEVLKAYEKVFQIKMRD